MQLASNEQQLILHRHHKHPIDERTVLVETMIKGLEKEFDLPMSEINTAQ
jgi:hypothetical protein